MLVVTDPKPESAELAFVQRALGAGELVVVPTDTVYGLAAHAHDEAAVRRMYELKGRDITQPTAVIYPSVTQLREELDWLSARASWAVAALLPGPWTVIVENSEGVMPWLTGGAPGPLGLRVPAGAMALPPIAATSANLPGEPPADNVRELAPALLDGLACVVSSSTMLSGPASTVLDITAWERGDGDVRVIRDAAGIAGQALAVLDGVPG